MYSPDLFVANIIKHLHFQSQTSWLGVTDIVKEGVFKYSEDETSLSWHNWNGQSGPIGNNEDMNCVKMDAEGKWQIEDCNNKVTFVCEGNCSDEVKVTIICCMYYYTF